MTDIINSSLSTRRGDELLNAVSHVADINTSRLQRFKNIYAALDTAWRSWETSQELRPVFATSL